MSKTVRNCFLILLAPLLSYIAYLGFETWRGAERSAYSSCLESVAVQIMQLNLSEDFFPNTISWKKLSEIETSRLMRKVHGGDCARFEKPEFDLWNHQINIAIKKPLKYPEIVIWSNGTDAISGTADDLIIPYGSGIPK